MISGSEPLLKLLEPSSNVVSIRQATLRNLISLCAYASFSSLDTRQSLTFFDVIPLWLLTIVLQSGLSRGPP